MPESPDHHTSIVAITGRHHTKLHLLANLSPTVGDPDSIWSVVTSLTHRPEIHWTREYMIESWFTSMDETSSGQLHAVSMDGDLWSSDQGVWSSQNLGCPEGLNIVWVGSDSDIFAGGPGGTITKISNFEPETFRDHKQREINAIHGTSPANVYAAGEGGVVYHYDGFVWEELESPTNSTLLTLLCNGDDVYVAGGDGTLFKKTGAIWHDLHTSDDVTITSLAWYQNTLFAAAGLQGIFRLGPWGLESFKNKTAYRLRNVGDLLFAFGNRLVMQFNGSGWWGGEIDI